MSEAEALAKRLYDAGWTSDDIAKHLIGRHQQDDHNPNRKRNPRLAEAKAPHRRKDHRTKAEKERNKARGRKYGRAVGTATGIGAAPFIAQTFDGLQQGMELEDAMRVAGKPYKNIGRGLGNAAKKVVKMDEINVVGEFAKLDEDKRQVFGWASIVEKNGEPVIDRQGDYISIDELEKAAYDYVLDSRVGGEMHQKALTTELNKSGPKQIGTMIESFVITKEKIAKMGLPEDTPTGWWIGFHVDDDKTWGKVKKGLYTGFSIHGVGSRKKVSKAEIMKRDDEFRGRVEELQKHLVGRHNQDTHSRKGHKGTASAKKGAKIGAGVGAAAGAVAGGLTGGAAGAVRGAAVNAVQGAGAGTIIGSQVGGTRLFGAKGGKGSGVANAVVDPWGTAIRRVKGKDDEEKKGLTKRDETYEIAKRMTRSGLSIDDITG